MNSELRRDLGAILTAATTAFNMKTQALFSCKTSEYQSGYIASGILWIESIWKKVFNCCSPRRIVYQTTDCLTRNVRKSNSALHVAAAKL